MQGHLTDLNQITLLLAYLMLPDNPSLGLIVISLPVSIIIIGLRDEFSENTDKTIVTK